jgi:hypothetical protein
MNLKMNGMQTGWSWWIGQPLGLLLAVIILLTQLGIQARAEAPNAFRLDQLALQADSEFFSQARIRLPEKADAQKQKAIDEAKRWFGEARLSGFSPQNENSLDASA